MNKVLRLACVEYFNTLPFLHGLSLLDSNKVAIELILAPPSDCSRLYLNDKADLALIPVGALDRLDSYRILKSFCIGCDGAVDTVAILSNVPIQSITTLHLDPHSNTSNRLVQILFKEYWQINPFFSTEQKDYDQESILAIGDKVFDLESKYKYKYDLGDAWKKHTGLPFVFAVWICKPSIDSDLTDQLETAFAIGMNQPQCWIPSSLELDHKKLMAYLTESIVYHFDASMKESLDLFEHKFKDLNGEQQTNS